MTKQANLLSMKLTAMDVARKFKTHGFPGDPIEGSKLVRDYCAFCFAAVRVREAGASTCEKCDMISTGPAIKPPHTGLTDRQKYGLRHTDS